MPIILNTFFDFSIIPQMFITHQRFLGVAWYIGAMLVGMMILYPLLVKHKRNFIYIFSPLIVLFTFGFMNKMDGGSYAAADVYYFGLLPKGLLAALGGLSLGTLSYVLSAKLRNVNLTKLSKFLLTTVYITSFVSIFFFACDPRSHYFYDSVMVVLLFVSISITFSNISIFEKVTHNKFVLYLEKLSLPLYLNQMWVMTIVHAIFPHIDKFYIFILISTVSTMAVSALTLILLNATNKLRIYLVNRYLRLFILQNHT